MLHLVIPASSAKPNLCRSLLSAAVLDYPLPVLINWAMEEDPDNEYKMHLAKISGILEYLRGLPPRNDKDLVLVVDGYDVWFQLRPEVLIQRYFEINAQRSAYFARKFRGDVVKKHNISQTVIFGSDKKCWPQTFDHPACYAVPESTLPMDAFGEMTDKDPESFAMRPRWLNSGTILGPIADVRAIFEATDRREKDRFNGMRDQWYFAELFGEQEYYRNSLQRHPNTFPPNHESHIIPDFPNPRNKTRLSPFAPNRIPQFEETAQVEFHIGLDYESELFHTNGYADQDTEWLTLDSSDPSQLGDGNEVYKTLPEDVRISRPPIDRKQLAEHSSDKFLLPFDSSDNLPYNMTWAEVPLLANVPAQSIPVIIHLNGNKSLLDEWWQRNWFVEMGYGRQLLRNSRDAPRGPLTTTLDSVTGEERIWWKGEYNSLHRLNGGMWTARGEWLPWKKVCGKFGHILFDGEPAGTPEDPKIAINKAYMKEKKEKEKAKLAKTKIEKAE